MAITVDELLEAFRLDALPATSGKGRPSKYAKEMGRDFRELVDNAPLLGASEAEIKANLANQARMKANYNAGRNPVTLPPEAARNIGRVANDSIGTMNERGMSTRSGGGMSRSNPSPQRQRMIEMDIYRPAANVPRVPSDKFRMANGVDVPSGGRSFRMKGTREFSPASKSIDDLIKGKKKSPFRSIIGVDSKPSIFKPISGKIDEMVEIAEKVPAFKMKGVTDLAKASKNAVKAEAKAVSKLSKVMKHMPGGKLGLLAAGLLGGGAYLMGKDRTPAEPSTGVPEAEPTAVRTSPLDNLLSQMASSAGAIQQDAGRMRRDADTRGRATRQAIENELRNRRY